MGRGSGVGLVGQEVIGIDTLPNLMSAVCIVHNTCVMCPPHVRRQIQLQTKEADGVERQRDRDGNGNGDREGEEERERVESRQSDNEPQGLS